MGTCTLDFNDPGNTDYVPATQAVQGVSVGQGANSITVTSTDTSATVGSTYVPTATATSGDTVVITVDSSSSGVCSISAGTVTFNHVGTCTLDFNDPGNTDYVPATQAVQVVSVGQGANSITVTSTDTSATVGSTSPHRHRHLGRHGGHHRRQLLFGRLLDQRRDHDVQPRGHLHP